MSPTALGEPVKQYGGNTRTSLVLPQPADSTLASPVRLGQSLAAVGSVGGHVWVDLLPTRVQDSDAEELSRPWLSNRWQTFVLLLVVGLHEKWLTRRAATAGNRSIARHRSIGTVSLDKDSRRFPFGLADSVHATAAY